MDSAESEWLTADRECDRTEGTCAGIVPAPSARAGQEATAMDEQRTRRIAEVVAEYVARRGRSTPVTREQLMAAHADLMPELAEELAIRSLIGQARVQAGAQAADSDARPDGTVQCSAPGAPRAIFVESSSESLTVSRVSLDRLTSHLGSRQEEAAAAPSADSIPGYQIIREIHRGGQGVVYEAVQLATRRTVAVKVLLEGPFASERARWRFEREVKLIAALKHPNIIIIHDSGIAHGKYYFAMDYVLGRPLDTHVRVTAPPLRALVSLFRRICDAVAYAHRRGVIHRDLKPSNILVGEDGTPCVLDFGLAKIIGDELAESQQGLVSIAGGLMGTIRYMSPEQTRANPELIDVRTDVYTLGVILYELLTGGPPYSTTSDLHTALGNIRTIDPPRPSRLRRDVDADLETIDLMAMAKEPERRYQSAGELSDDLLAWLEGRPISARSASSLYVIRKIAVKHSFESIVLLALVLAVAGLGGVAVHSYAWGRSALSQKERSDRAAASSHDDMELLRDQSTRVARTESLGWFLLEWQAGRLQTARRLHASFPKNSPEFAATAFLLNKDETFDQLLLKLPPDEKPLAYFVAGERACQRGAAQEAVEAYEVSLRSTGNGWMRSYVQARLEMLAAAEARPATRPVR